MLTRIEMGLLTSRLTEIHDFLKSKISHDRSKPALWSGWHNLFTTGRIGPAGTAVPILFLCDAGQQYEHRASVVEALLGMQKQGPDEGGWSILSLPDVAVVEATSWCLRALIRAGDQQARPAISAAEAWLLANQSGDGGWGSNRDNRPRTLTTELAIDALCSVGAKPRNAIDSGVRWIFANQRPDGSWGAEPGQDGTLSHTAGIVRLLCRRLLMSPSEPHIARALTWLIERWRPVTKRWADEVYEVHQSKRYGKIPLTHDVDSIVLEALMTSRTDRAVELVCSGMHSLTLPSQHFSVTPEGRQPSVWTVVPAGWAMLTFMSYMPTVAGGRIYSLGKATIVDTNPTRSLGWLLCRLFFSHLAPSLRTVIICISTACAVGCIYLYVTKQITGKELLLSFGVEIGGLVFSVILDRKSK